jgi:hypothetical protein
MKPNFSIIPVFAIVLLSGGNSIYLATQKDLTEPQSHLLKTSITIFAVSSDHVIRKKQRCDDE